MECSATGRPRPTVTWNRRGSTLQLVTQEINGAHILKVKRKLKKKTLFNIFFYTFQISFYKMFDYFLSGLRFAQRTQECTSVRLTTMWGNQRVRSSSLWWVHLEHQWLQWTLKRWGWLRDKPLRWSVRQQVRPLQAIFSWKSSSSDPSSLTWFFPQGSPPPVISWSKLRAPLPWRHTVADGVLTLTDVGRQDSGQYICNATNIHGYSEAYTEMEVDSEYMVAWLAVINFEERSI